MEHKKILLTATLLMMIAVILGAMGAHYLKETLHLPADRLESWKTGVFYQIIHSLAIILIIILAKMFDLKIKAVNILFIIGIAFFSGSIYILTLNHIWGIGALKSIMGPITPLGGMCLIIGWAILSFKILKAKS